MIKFHGRCLPCMAACLVQQSLYIYIYISHACFAMRYWSDLEVFLVVKKRQKLTKLDANNFYLDPVPNTKPHLNVCSSWSNGRWLALSTGKDLKAFLTNVVGFKNQARNMAPILGAKATNSWFYDSSKSKFSKRKWSRSPLKKEETFKRVFPLSLWILLSIITPLSNSNLLGHVRWHLLFKFWTTSFPMCMPIERKAFLQNV